MARTARGAAASAALLSTLLVTASSVAAPGAPAPEVAEDPWDEAVLTALADDVVRVASYYAQDVRQAPGLVAVVTRREILGLGARTVADVLRTLPGVDVVLANDGRVRPAIRGLDQRADVLLLLDGQRVNDALTGAAVYELPASIIERIEVVRGPGSALYGSNAFLGVVSVTTRQSDRLETAVRYGSFSTVGLSASVGDRSGPWRYALVADVVRSDGPDVVVRSDSLLHTDPEVTRAPHAVDGSYGRLTTLMTAGRGPVDVGVALVGETRGPYVGPTNTLALGSELQDHFASAWARLEVDLLPRLRGRVRAFSSHWGSERSMVLHPPGWASNDADVDGDGLPEVFPDGHLERADHALLSSGLDLQGLCDGAWLGRVVAGVDLRYQRAYDAGYASNDEGGLYRSATADHDGLSFPDVDRVFLAPYLQWERALAGWASVTIGARYDVYQDFGSELSLRGGLVVRPASDTTVKLLGATAFRAPTLFELHSPHRERLGNPDLDAEAIRTVEVQVAQRLLDHYELRLAGYHLDMDNRIDVPLVTAIEGRSAYLNHPGTTGWGGDVELRALWPGGSWLSVGGAWHRTTDTETDERLARVAPWSADVGGSVHVYGGLHAGGGLRYRSARQPPAFSYFQRTWLRGHDEPARLMLDLTLRAEDLPAGVSLRASAQNVLGTPWREVPEDVTMSLRSGPDGPENLPGEPRTFLVELAHHF